MSNASKPNFGLFYHTPDLTFTESPVSKCALETIGLLRSELERCQVDLETDEQLFAEKVDELNELQSNYDTLMREKERVEEMWRRTRETENQLKSDIMGLLEKLTSLEEEVAVKDDVIQQLRDSLERKGEAERRQGRDRGLGEDVQIETNERVLSVSEGIESQSADAQGDEDLGSEEASDFMAIRSLLKGKVNTDSLEVGLL